MHSQAGRQGNLKHMLNYEAFSREYGADAPIEEVLLAMFDNYARSNLGVPQVVSPVPEDRWDEIENTDTFGLVDETDWKNNLPPEYDVFSHAALPASVLSVTPTGYMNGPVASINGQVIAAKTFEVENLVDFKPEGEWYLYKIFAVWIISPETFQTKTSYRIRYGVKT